MSFSRNATEEAARIGFSYISKLLNDLFTELEKYVLDLNDKQLLQISKNNFLLNIPFENKITFLEDKLSQINLTDEQRVYFQNKINEIREKNLIATAGLNELKEVFSSKTNGINNWDKDDVSKINKIIKEAEYSLSDPCISQISKDIYSRTIQILNEHGLLNNISVQKGTDGYYYLFYSNYMKEIVQNASVKAAYSLGKIKEPTKKELDHIIWATTGFNHTPSELIIKNVDDALSQKIIREGNKKDKVFFARTQNPDGTYNLYCDAGRDGIDKDEIYSEVQKILLYSIGSLSGPNKDIERTRMKEYFNVTEKINNVLDAIDDPKEDDLDYGYVFSVSNNGRQYRPNDYIRFDRERFTIHTPNGKEQTLEKHSDYEFRYLLERNIKSGTGTKIYLSNEEINNVMTNENEIIRLIREYPSVNEINKQTLNLQAELSEMHDKATLTGIKNEIKNLSIAATAFNFASADNKNINNSHVKEALLSSYIQSKMPKVVCYDTDKTKEIQAQNRFFAWCVNNLEHSKDFDLSNNFVALKPSENTKEYPTYDLKQIISKVDKEMIDNYADYLISIAVPDSDENIDAGKFTISEARKEFSFISKNIDNTLAEVSNTIDNITFSMEQVIEPTDVEFGVDKQDSLKVRNMSEKTQENINSLLNTINQKDDVIFEFEKSDTKSFVEREGR